jgi:hypothetical protein
MPVIMKNAVYARKTLAKKARSQLLEQSRQENAKTLGKTTTNIYCYMSYICFDLDILFCMVFPNYGVVCVNVCMM